MNDVSRAIVYLVHAFNDAYGEVRLGYTFDAGPNAVLMVQKQHAAEALAAVLKYFPPAEHAAEGYVNRPELQTAAEAVTLPAALFATFAAPPQPGAVRYVYHTKVGPGAALLGEASSLAGADGKPLHPSTQQRVH